LIFTGIEISNLRLLPRFQVLGPGDHLLKKTMITLPNGYLGPHPGLNFVCWRALVVALLRQQSQERREESEKGALADQIFGKQEDW
jgi:hypothetical protein